MKMNDIDIYDVPIGDLPFQDEYDAYVKQVYTILEDSTRDIDEDIVDSLIAGLNILSKYRKCLNDISFYKEKYIPVKPNNMLKSQIKKCKIATCNCGMLLIESKDICCPKCHQFIDWTGDCPDI